MKQLTNTQKQSFKPLVVTLFAALMSTSLVGCGGGGDASSSSTPASAIVEDTPPTLAAPSSSLLGVIVHEQNDNNASQFYTDKSSAASYKVVEVKNTSTQSLTINKILVPSLIKVVNDSIVIPSGKIICTDSLQLSEQGDAGDSCLVVLNADGKLSNQSSSMEIKTSQGDKTLDITVKDEAYMTGLRDNDAYHRSLARWDGTNWNFSDLDVSSSMGILDSYDTGVSGGYFSPLSPLVTGNDGSLLATIAGAGWVGVITETQPSSPSALPAQSANLISATGVKPTIKLNDENALLRDHLTKFDLYGHGSSGKFGSDGSLTLSYGPMVVANGVEAIIGNDSLCYAIAGNKFHQININPDNGVSCATEIPHQTSKRYYGDFDATTPNDENISLWQNENGDLIVVNAKNYTVMTKGENSAGAAVRYDEAKLSYAASGGLYLAMIRYDDKVYNSAQLGWTFKQYYSKLNIELSKFNGVSFKKVTDYHLPLLQNRIVDFGSVRMSPFNLAVAPRVIVNVE